MDGLNRGDHTIDIAEENANVAQDGIEYVLSANDDGIVAYKIVHDMQTTTTDSNNATAASQQMQYIVIDNANGFIQAVPTQTSTTNSNQSLKSRSSVAIAPKALGTTQFVTASTTSSTRSNQNNNITQTTSAFKKRDDRRRATHNEVERRRRDKINHWIMKLGSIIPADGTSVEIGDSGRLSVAAVEGQSKGGILSKACEYVQMLQEKQNLTEKERGSTIDNKAAYEKKKHEEEIARLRGENELLKAILVKHGINYMKERNSFKSEEYS